MKVSCKKRINIEDLDINVLHDGRMDVKNTAKYLDCAPNTLRRYMAMGVSPPYVKIVTRIFFYKNEVDKWVESQIENPAIMKARLKKLKEDRK